MLKKVVYWMLNLVATIGISIGGQYLLKEIVDSGIAKYDGLINFIFAIIVLPVFLIVFHNYLSKKFGYNVQPIGFGVILLLGLFLFSSLEYYHWMAKTGIKTDAESRDVFAIGISIQFIIGSCIGMYGFLSWRNYLRRESVEIIK